MTDNIAFGKKGEDLAVDFLKEEGYEILERNWHFNHTEIDIIARFHEFLVIAEVKTRKGNSWGEPYTAVDYRKQRSLIFAAERYIYSHHIDLEVRFDIVSIIIDNDRTAIEHVKDAFRAIAR
ncbi:MAG TPA: YraN family protein [Bacteroidales bacterium]|nr:YraN family protein [Bacteroidales bacterium]